MAHGAISAPGYEAGAGEGTRRTRQSRLSITGKTTKTETEESNNLLQPNRQDPHTEPLLPLAFQSQCSGQGLHTQASGSQAPRWAPLVGKLIPLAGTPVRSAVEGGHNQLHNKQATIYYQAGPVPKPNVLYQHST